MSFERARRLQPLLGNCVVPSGDSEYPNVTAKKTKRA
jgi:hypothetical protein